MKNITIKIINILKESVEGLFDLLFPEEYDKNGKVIDSNNEISFKKKLFAILSLILLVIFIFLIWSITQ